MAHLGVLHQHAYTCPQRNHDLPRPMLVFFTNMPILAHNVTMLFFFILRTALTAAGLILSIWYLIRWIGTRNNRHLDRFIIFLLSTALLIAVLLAIEFAFVAD